jgi:hypothetical protein
VDPRALKGSTARSEIACIPVQAVLGDGLEMARPGAWGVASGCPLGEALLRRGRDTRRC